MISRTKGLWIIAGIAIPVTIGIVIWQVTSPVSPGSSKMVVNKSIVGAQEIKMRVHTSYATHIASKGIQRELSNNTNK
jgi:hypothetical protein